MELVNYLVLRSPNIGNIGTIKQRPKGFMNPDYYEISDEELEAFKLMNPFYRSAFISDKLEAQLGTPVEDKKKVAQIVEAVESQEEKESVEMPETGIDEPLNEPVNEVEEISESEYEEVKKEFNPIVDEMISNAEKEITKPKGRPKKEK